MSAISPLSLHFRVARWLVSGYGSEVEIACSIDGDEVVSDIHVELRSQAVEGGVAEHRIEGSLEPGTHNLRHRIGIRPAAPGVYPNSTLHVTVSTPRGLLTARGSLPSITITEKPASLQSLHIGDKAFWGITVDGDFKLPHYETINGYLRHYFDEAEWQAVRLVWTGFPVTRALKEGFVFDKRFRLIRPLGLGGMGVVWLAADSELKGEQVALKFLPDDVCHDPEAIDDLRDEVLKVRNLSHDNIVRIYDFIKADGTAAISMEFIDGPTLAAHRRTLPNKVFEVEDVLRILPALCSALDYAHSRQPPLIHHDLKPQNLMLTANGVLKVCDFGLAGSLCETKSKLTNRRQHTTSGTTAYMSPQHLLLGSRTVADDIYSLGATLYELFTTKPPFFIGHLEHQIIDVPPSSIAERRAMLNVRGRAVPERWERVIQLCLSKYADRRPKSCAMLFDQLQIAIRTQNLSSLPQKESTALNLPSRREDASPKVVVPGRSVQKPLVDKARPLVVESEKNKSIDAVTRRPRMAAVIGALLGLLLLCMGAVALNVYNTKSKQKQAKLDQDTTTNADNIRLRLEKQALEKLAETEKQKRMAVEAEISKVKQNQAVAEAKMKEVLTASPPPKPEPIPIPQENILDQGSTGKKYVAHLPGGVDMELCFCPRGNFTMGSPPSEDDHFHGGKTISEEQQVEVTLSQPFWMARTEVTQRQWKALIASNPQPGG